MTASAAITQQMNHVGRFTQTENTAIVYTFRGWLAALAGNPDALQAADDAWSATTLLEHFDSSCDPNPASWSPDQLNVFAILTANAQASQDAFDKIMGAGTNEDNRMNANVATYVASVLAKL